jgi:BMFP domain-containing protein YqiC
MEPFERFSPAMLAARVREVCDRVGAHARGRPYQEVRAELEEAFRETNQWMPLAELDLMARSIADPSRSMSRCQQVARSNATKCCSFQLEALITCSADSGLRFADITPPVPGPTTAVTRK